MVSLSFPSSCMLVFCSLHLQSWSLEVSGVRSLRGPALLSNTWDFTSAPGGKFSSSDGNEGDRFGRGVARCGKYAIVGAPYDKYHGIMTGSAYIYRLNDNSWKFESKVSPTSGNDEDMFGWSIGCDGNFTAIGAYMDDYVAADGGAVYLYVRDSKGAWKADTILHSYYFEDDEYFGYSVAVSGDLVLVGAVGSSQFGPFTGIVYSFRRSPEELTDDMIDDDVVVSNDDGVPMGWKIEAVFYPADVGPNSYFGYHIAADRSIILVTHYQRLLDYITPDFVHVLANGRILRSGDKSLALELEDKGYAWLDEVSEI